jgi:hypothetical protein
VSARARAFPFPLIIFLSAFLLFQVQPMMGRYVLPWFGGGPAVWTNCLLFFQALLLAGYAYAHWLGSRPSFRMQGSLHVAVLAASLLFLPIGPRATFWKPASSGDPSGHILLLLAATVGGPYLLLSSTGPLLQRWFTLSEPGRSPWRLYALSNLGSFLALLSYPFVIEPYVRLHVQAWTWSALYVVFAALCGWTAWRLRSAAPALAETPAAVEGDDAEARPEWKTVLFWIGLAAAGSVLLIATTSQLSQDMVVNPFLWVAPLSLYLLTFILAFEWEGFYRPTLFAILAGVAAPAGCAMQSTGAAQAFTLQLAVYLLTLFIVCLLCHGELARSRPAARYLTTFYLAIAAGGAVGGVFGALIAPHVFKDLSEYPIGLGAACLLGFLGWVRRGAMSEWTSRNLAVRLPLMALLLGGATAMVAASLSPNGWGLTSQRNFYGILRVSQNVDRNGPRRDLKHGRILHGFQYQESPQRTWPTTYYGPHSGVGIALQAFERANRRVAVVGLGTGTMAAWGRPGDTFRFYEINPSVESIARTWFSYLKDSKARTEVVLGDARVQLERELAAGQSQDYDVIVVDAFSGDAIPMHLLTAECGDIYRRRLAPGGLLLLHISNQVLNLEPVARGLARYLGWQVVQYISAVNETSGESRSQWVLITADHDFLQRPEVARATSTWTLEHPDPIVWTDDFASLWHVLDF